MNKAISKIVNALYYHYYSRGGDRTSFFDFTLSLTAWKILSDYQARITTDNSDHNNIPYIPEQYRFSFVMQQTIEKTQQSKITETIEKLEQLLPPSMKGLLALEHKENNHFTIHDWSSFRQLWLDLADQLDNVALQERAGCITSALDILITGPELIRTPKELGSMMAALLNPAENTTVLDPFCRTGDLLEAVQKQTQNTAIISGITESSFLRKWSAVRLLSDLREDVNIYPTTLTESPFEHLKFDFIITNPPFGISEQLFGRVNRHFKREWTSLLEQASRSDMSLAIQVLNSLSPNGKAAIILPAVFLSGMGVFNEFRKLIIEKNILDAVINLPPGIFPRSGVTTAILLFNKNRHHDKVFLFNAATDSISSSGSLRSVQLNSETTNKFISQFLSQDFTQNPHAVVISTQEITAQKYELRYSAYRDLPYEQILEDGKSVNQLLEESRDLEEQLKQARRRIASLLKKH
ncbi:class I SAM-dependent DNA methyltransferase [Chitinophaga sp. HK235]|uniref:HsdM family class I SAM-dependent methyltransferase n=1 Tax=Chitinophaga sp. HK235 TaxID=2952571 RepID=UPI001BA65653|nr:N-6 DNA methylase [Chitinophaga sp. HK235]